MIPARIRSDWTRLKRVKSHTRLVDATQVRVSGGEGAGYSQSWA